MLANASIHQVYRLIRSPPSPPPPPSHPLPPFRIHRKPSPLVGKVAAPVVSESGEALPPPPPVALSAVDVTQQVLVDFVGAPAYHEEVRGLNSLFKPG
jgi:hypothetical protein